MKKILIALGLIVSTTSTGYAAKPVNEPEPEPSGPIVLYCDGVGESNYYISGTGERVEVFRPSVQWGFTLTFPPEGATLGGGADYAESDVPVPLTVDQIGPNEVYLQGSGRPGSGINDAYYNMHLARQTLNFTLHVQDEWGDIYHIEGTCSTQEPQI